MMAAAQSGTLPGISPHVYDVADFNAITRMVYAHSGIAIDDGKAMLVYSRLAPLVRECGCGTFGNYAARMREVPEELSRAVAALTTNHTYFFRETHHFEHFARDVRPDLIRSLNAGRSVRLWSAGCSSGEEPWSLAMAMLGERPAEGEAIARRDIRLLATDIAPDALRRAAAGDYAEGEMRQVPAPLRRAWTGQEGTRVSVGAALRSIVRFRSLNLQGQWPMRRQFEAIFCRNVMIYFDLAAKERLLARFADVLAPGGYLYVGHSERVTGPAAAALRPAGSTIYRKVQR